jgi:formate hydrogenlyase subunit 3/multisubunit Na+/H+ antiporter MnhD subunit
MAAAANLLIVTIGFWLLSCIVISILGRRVSHLYASAALYVGGASLFITAILGWSIDSTFSIAGIGSIPVYLAVAPLSFRIDALSSIFIALLSRADHGRSALFPRLYAASRQKIKYGRLLGATNTVYYRHVGVLIAANAPTFLLNWELMALSSALLIATNLSNQDSRRAAFIYLGATRIGTAFLMTGFFWMYIADRKLGLQ